jgi:hypothetical protein
VDTKTLLTMPLAEVLEYNFLDTYYMYRVYLQLREELKEQPRLLRLFKLLMMPAHEELVYSEMRGIWLDVPRLKDRKPIAQDKLKEIEDAISAYLPARDSDLWPSDSRGRPLSPNYNASNFARWFLFTHLKLPILARGKEKADGSPGDPSMAEGVLLELEEHHPVVRLMLNRVQWQKALSSFFNAYEEIYDEDHRIHTNFKLAGTVTGRLSSGKADRTRYLAPGGKYEVSIYSKYHAIHLSVGSSGHPPAGRSWKLTTRRSSYELQHSSRENGTCSSSTPRGRIYILLRLPESPASQSLESARRFARS